MKKTTVAIIIVLGLGTGGALGLFSLLDAVVLRELPVPRPDELVVATPVHTTTSASDEYPYPVAAYQQLAPTPGLFTAVAGVSGTSYLGGAPGSDERWWTTVDGVTNGYFDVLGLRPQAGRFLTATEIEDSAPVAVASGQFWAHRLGASPHAVGSTITLQGVTLTIIGITPAAFRGLETGRSTDLIVPFGLFPALGHMKPDHVFLSQLFGRRAPGVTTAQVEAALDAQWPAALRQAMPAWLTPGQARPFAATRIQARSAATGFSFVARSEYQRVLSLLVLAGMLVVALACVNVSTLLLAQSAARDRELGIRAALGASPARLVRHVFAQALRLSVLGTAAGVPIAIWSARELSSMLFSNLDSAPFDFTPDRNMIAAVVATAIVSALVVVVFPAFRATRSDLMRSMRSAAGAAARTRRWGHRLLVAQVAAATVLLVAGWMVTANVQRLLSRPGFAVNDVTLVRLDARPGGYPDRFDVAAYQRRIAETIAAVPGIQAVGLKAGALFGGAGGDRRPVSSPDGAGRGDASYLPLSPGALGVLDVPLVHGRDFSWADDAAHARVVIVSTALARAVFGSASALGKRLQIGRGDLIDTEIVGVAADARLVDLRQDAQAIVYTPLAQERSPVGSPEVLIRASTPAAAWLPQVRSRIQSMGQDDVPQIAAMSQVMGWTLLPERLVAIGGAYFAGLAGLIMAIGLSGLLAYSVSCRTREIGIRGAIGASASSIRWLVVREAMTTVITGLVIGLAGAGLLTRAIVRAPIPIGTPALAAFAGATAMTVLIGVVAAWLPARRAAALSALDALRSE